LRYLSGIGVGVSEPLFDLLMNLIGEDTMANPRVQTLLSELGITDKKAFCPSCFKVEARAAGVAKADTSRVVWVCQSCHYRFTLPLVGGEAAS
jgi:transposase-like protein